MHADRPEARRASADILSRWGTQAPLGRCSDWRH